MLAGMTTLLVASIALTAASVIAWTGLVSDMAIVVIGAVLACLVWLGLQLPPHLANMATLGGGVGGDIPPTYTLWPLVGFVAWCVGAVAGALMRPGDEDDLPV